MGVLPHVGRSPGVSLPQVSPARRVGVIDATPPRPHLPAPAAARDRRRGGRPALQIDVLSNRADLVSAGDALVAIDLPAGADAVEGPRHRRRARRHERVRACARTAASRALVTGLDVGAQRAHRERARAARRATADDRQPPQRRPGVLRPADPAVGLPGGRGRRAVQPARDLRVPVQVRPAAAFAAYDPENPPSDVATTTTDQGKTVPYIVRVETGYQDRDQYKIAVLYDPAKPLDAVGAAGRLEPQAAHHPRRELRHRAPGRQRARRHERRRRSRRGFAVMSTALNNAGHNCNLVTQAESMVMAKERLVEQYGDDPLHDRHRLLGRLAHPAAGRQRLPRHLPGDPAGLLLPRRVVDRPAARRLQPAAPATSRTRRSGRPAWSGTRCRSAAVEGHPNHVNSIVFDTRLLDRPRRAGRRLRRRARRAGLQRRDQPRRRALHAGRLHDQRLRPAPGERLERRRSRRRAAASPGIPLDNVGVQYGLEALQEGPDHAGPVRRPQREDRRR